MKREFTLDELRQIRTYWWDSAQDGQFGDKLRKLYEAISYVRQSFQPGNCERLTLADGLVIDGEPVYTDGHLKGPLTVTQANLVRLVDTTKRLYIPGKWELEVDDLHYSLMQEKRKTEEAKKKAEELQLTRELLLTEEDQYRHAEEALNMLRGLAG